MNPDQIMDITLRQCIETAQDRTFSDILKLITIDLEVLIDSGAINLGPDHTLTGESLEIRTRIIFQLMSFEISKGRPGLEDFIVHKPDGFSPQDPIVLEVKSSRKAQISRDDLRQLDDWVFDLSGEEMARKHGLGGGVDAMAIATDGMMIGRKRHPSPHKGAFIFNGLIGTHFQDRPEGLVSQNDIDFIEKRNLCIVPLNILLTYLHAFQADPSIKKLLWEKIHVTAGIIDAAQ